MFKVFRRKLFLAWRMASENLSNAPIEMKQLYERKAVVRAFSPVIKFLHCCLFQGHHLGPSTWGHTLSSTRSQKLLMLGQHLKEDAKHSFVMSTTRRLCWNQWGLLWGLTQLTSLRWQLMMVSGTDDAVLLGWTIVKSWLIWSLLGHLEGELWEQLKS